MAKQTKTGYGNKDGSQKGKAQGGNGRNETASCRHPNTKRGRK